MAVRAVIFDWGGTLTPWHTIDHEALWQAVCTPHFPAGQVAEVAAAICAAEHELWAETATAHTSATIARVMERAGVEPTDALLAGYFEMLGPAHADRPGGGAAAARAAGAGNQDRGPVEHDVAAQRARAGVHPR